MTTWFTSDTHFGHKNIIGFCNRPWTTVEEMDEGLIKNWNERVRPGDFVYHLGDVSFHKDRAKTIEILRRLNGIKILIRGNHDAKQHRDVLREFHEVCEYKELKLGPGKIVLFHYPMRSWNGSFHGSWQLHGHTHGTMSSLPRQLDVGVDVHQWYPTNLDEVAMQMWVNELEESKA